MGIKEEFKYYHEEKPRANQIVHNLLDNVSSLGRIQYDIFNI